MVHENTWFETDDGTKLFLHHWMPDPDARPADMLPTALALIVHGMAEHAGRYARLAEKLVQAGMEVWAADQRGHGKTADLKINRPDSGGLQGHCADSESFFKVTADNYALCKEIRKKQPNIPFFLLGHSWGSFVAQYLIEDYSHELNINGCVLSGTRGPAGLREKASMPIMILIALIRGQRNGSRLAKAVADGPYNIPFRPNRTNFDWLSRDEKEVDAFVEDPFCGNLCSTGFYRDLVKGLILIHEPQAMSKINPNLAVYIVSGSTDPVGEMGASPTALVNAYRSLHITDMEFVLYPGARHEIFNETNREEVMDNLVSWIGRHYMPSAGER